MDVGGKNSHRLSPTYYTLIADIKPFASSFKLKRSFPPQRNHQENEISSPRRASAEIHSALVGGADHRSDGQIPTIFKPGFGSLTLSGIDENAQSFLPLQHILL